jgi:outer membrane protein with beta-barrel domain
LYFATLKPLFMRSITFMLLIGISIPALSQIRVGFSASAIYSNISLRHESESDIVSNGLPFSVTGNNTGTTKGLISYVAGLVADARISSDFSLRMNFQYIQKGWKESDHYFQTSFLMPPPPLTTYDYQESFKIDYLEIPLYFLFSPPLGKTKLLIGVGPYIGLAMSGKYKFQIVNTTDPSIKDSIDMIGVNKYQKKRAVLSANGFDSGITITSGLEFRNGMFFNCSLFSGLRDVMTDRYFVFSNKYFYLTAGVGIFFHK